MSLEYADLQGILDPALIQKVDSTQHAWLNFRDKNCGFDREFVNGAPLALVLSSFCRLRMTGERTIKLIKFRDWSQIL